MFKFSLYIFKSSILIHTQKNGNNSLIIWEHMIKFYSWKIRKKIQKKERIECDKDSTWSHQNTYLKCIL